MRLRKNLWIDLLWLRSELHWRYFHSILVGPSAANSATVFFNQSWTWWQNYVFWWVLSWGKTMVKPWWKPGFPGTSRLRDLAAGGGWAACPTGEGKTEQEATFPSRSIYIYIYMYIYIYIIEDCSSFLVDFPISTMPGRYWKLPKFDLSSWSWCCQQQKNGGLIIWSAKECRRCSDLGWPENIFIRHGMLICNHADLDGVNHIFDVCNGIWAADGIRKIICAKGQRGTRT